jgi:AcrR family transcriptional regulator
MEAMIDAVAEQGYGKTTVADLHIRAGVSRKAFYEQFANKEECFLETYDAVVAEGLRRVANAYRAAEGDLGGMQASLEALVERAIENPRVLRLVLVEIGGVGPAGIERRERLIAGYERMLRENLGVATVPGMIPTPILRAIVGGLSNVFYTRAQSRRQGQLRKLVPDLMRWLTSYYHAPAEAMETLLAPYQSRPTDRLEGGRAPGTLWPNPIAGRRRGLRGEHTGSHSFVVHNQRERILDAVANLSAAKGYAAITVKDIAEGAAVSLDAFYEHFADKEDAFLVAYEVGHGKGLAIVQRAYDAAHDWRWGVRAGIVALFDFLASEPAFAHLALVDALIATSRSAERAAKGVTVYAQMLVPGLEQTSDAEQLPAVTIEAIAGGIFELCLTYTLQKRTQDLPEMVPRTTYFALTPFIGAMQAARIATETDPD